MSWKGFSKSIVRTPQTFRQKFNMGQITKDPVYMDAERRFKELESEVKKLHTESQKYSEAIHGMLNHQIEFSKAIEEIYKPISGKVSDPNAVQPEDNPQGIAACTQYREIVSDIQAQIKPELEMIETRIVAPATELIEVIKKSHKMLQKRNHKQIDLDRYTNTYKKLSDKKEKTLKDEKAFYKAESDLEAATQEYEYYNEMLKTELPQLFAMEADFIKPLFQSLYYMQLNVFYILHSRMQELKIPYFDLNSDIEECFKRKRGNVQEQAEAISITKFNLGRRTSKLDNKRYLPGGHQAYVPPGQSPTSPPPYQPGGVAGATPEKYEYQPAAANNAYGAAQPQAPGGYGQPQPAYGQPQPVTPTYQTPATGYGQPQQQQPAYASSPAYGSPAGYGGVPSPFVAQPAMGAATSAAAAVPAPLSPAPAMAAPAPTPAPAATQGKCQALYDYTAQAQGDLTFKAGEVIDVVQRTDDANGWWTGSLRGQTGVFPGNYVKLL